MIWCVRGRELRIGKESVEEVALQAGHPDVNQDGVCVVGREALSKGRRSCSAPSWTTNAGILEYAVVAFVWPEQAGHRSSNWLSRLWRTLPVVGSKDQQNLKTNLRCLKQVL